MKNIVYITTDDPRVINQINILLLQKEEGVVKTHTILKMLDSTPEGRYDLSKWDRAYCVMIEANGVVHVEPIETKK